MMRFLKVRVCKQIVFLFCIIALRSELATAFWNPTEVLRLSKCVYRNIHYGAGDFVKTGEPCLNCTCSNGAIVCHLRVCTPIPNPPPPGCFILHKNEMCCPELICNDDNNILFDALEARSRPGSNEDVEIELENFTKMNRNRGCVINGTTYAEGSALSSSTDCNYCFCLKGQEQCIRPNCILQLSGCTPVFNKHACCPVKYNCHGSDNVTIISTELSLGHGTRITPTENNKELLISGNENQIANQEMNLTTEKAEFSKAMTEMDRVNDQRQTSMESSSLPIDDQRKYMHNNDIQRTRDEATEFSVFTNATLADSDGSARLTDETPSAQTVTEISTSISLIKTELVLKEIVEAENQSSFVEERRNNFSEIGVANLVDSTQPYDRNFKTNFTGKAESTKTIPPEIEAYLNITKKKQEGDYELDYDEPTLPPSLPNLKIIPFVAADALDKPKDAIIEHREDTSVIIGVTDSIPEPPLLQPGQFSPPVKTEGGFVPRDPILDGPYFESNYNSIYTSESIDINPSEHFILPSITESSKVVENALCTNGYLTYRHGELISEPKACNMCLCLYGEIICQKPECPAVRSGCRRVSHNEDVSNCCGKIICDDISTSAAVTTESEKTNDETVLSESKIINVTRDYSSDGNFPNNIIPTETITTVSLLNPTYMTFKVKGKNHTKIESIGESSTVKEATERISPSRIDHTTHSGLTELKKSTSTEKMDADYDNSFSLENMLSFLFDEPPVLKAKNATTETSKIEHTLVNISTDSISSTPPVTSADSQSNTSFASASAASALTTSHTSYSVVQLLTPKIVTESTTTNLDQTTKILFSTKPVKSETETDSIIYRIRNDNHDNLSTKSVTNYTDDQTNTIKQINSYYVPPLGNFEEVILNPTKKPFGSSKKPSKINPYYSTTYRPRHTTAKVIPLSRPSEKNVPQIIAGDPGAASGLLKLSGCNIFGRMYRIGKIIAELSSPCLQCMCAEVGVHCSPLKC